MEICEDFFKSRKIRSGSFSTVYKSKCTKTQEYLALKIWPLKHTYQAKSEIQIMSQLPKGSYFPTVRWAGIQNNEFVLAMTLLGKNLDELLQLNKLDKENIFNSIIQTVKALEILHNKGYIHKDIKPANICRGNKKKKKFFLIDFGISEAFVDQKTKIHMRRRSSSSFKGNLAFCSNNVICGISPSRRDDLESLCYVLIYLLKRELPWLHEREILGNVWELRGLSTKKLVQDIPEEVETFFNYCRNLQFEEQPDYSYLVDLLLLSKRKMIEIINSDLIVIRKSHRKKRTRSIKRKLKKKSLSLVYNLQETLVAELPQINQMIRNKFRDFRNNSDQENKSHDF